MDSMITLNDLGVKVIGCKNKITTSALQDRHYEMNQIIYNYGYRPLNYKSASRIRRVIKQNLIAIHDMEVVPAAKPKQQEIIERAKGYFIILNDYIRKGDYDTEAANKVLKWQIHKYLAAKANEELTEANIIALLNENKVMAEDYDNADTKVMDNIKRTQQALIDALTEEYKID